MQNLKNLLKNILQDVNKVLIERNFCEYVNKNMLFSPDC
jgi:hypothetical protein